MFVLDTNIVIGLMARRAPAIVDRFRREMSRRQNIALSVIVEYELRVGASKSANVDRNHSRLDDFIADLHPTLEFTTEDAREAADIRAYLEARGIPIGPYDVLIAAQVRRRSGILVTLDRHEFERVPGLMVTDWRN